MAGKVIICDKNVSASGGGRGQKTVEHIEQKVSRISSISITRYARQFVMAICGGESDHICYLAVTLVRVVGGVAQKLSYNRIIDLKTVVYSSRWRNCRGIELSSRDFKTVAISVTRAKLYCIKTWFACTSPSP